MWTTLNKGSFVVSSLYKDLMLEVNVLDNCASWKLKFPLKIKIFLWYLKMGTYLVETTTSWKPVQTMEKKWSKFTKNHTCRWYDDIQFCKISCPNLTSFVRYRNNKFLTNHLDCFLAWNLLFLYLTNEIEFWIRYFIRLCIIISSTYLIFCVNLDYFFAVVCTDFHEGCGLH